MKLSIDEVWENCIAMFKWINEILEYGNYHVDDLKDWWLNKHGFEGIRNDCFFCNETPVDYKKKDCSFCPARKIDPKFNCLDSEIHYAQKPKAFLAELIRLNEIRKKL